MTQDRSAVFQRDMLDQEHAKRFVLPWLFETNEGDIRQFKTEGEACTAQREYRRAHGFDPITGERKAA